MSRVFVVFDNNSHGERRAALVSAFLARLWIVDEEAYLVRVKGVCGFLEASARPVPTWRVMFYPAPIGRAGDVFEGFVKVEGCHWSPFLREGVLVFAGCIVSR